MNKTDIRNKIRMIMRKVLRINENRKIVPTIKKRIRFFWEKRVYKENYSTQDLIEVLRKMGITSGDHIMVHCSYEDFYRYTGTPMQLIDALIELVGEHGTVFMPCYGRDTGYFDVRRSPSAAGLLSEVFRRKKGVKRSLFPNFSVAGYGAKAEEITGEHWKSQNAFDAYSPYYKFSQIPGSKVVALGLPNFGYLTVLHCVDWILKDEFPYYQRLMKGSISAVMLDEEGRERTVNMVTRINTRGNNRRKKRVLYSIPFHRRAISKLSNLSLIVFGCKEALNAGEKLARQGKPIYKKPKPKKSLFVPIQEGK